MVDKNCENCCWASIDKSGALYCINGDKVTDEDTCELWESKYG